MLPEAKGEDLLYASVQTTCCVTGGANVYVFAYPNGRKLVGELSVTSNIMYGLCSDRKGDVFVTDNSEPSGSGLYSYVYEYKHGGSEPSATFLDPWAADGCSVDPATGNLAVANWFTGGSEQTGNVIVYDGTTGRYTTYFDSKIPYVKWCAYDDNGNLYIDGADFGTQIAVLRKGETSFSNIELNYGEFLPDSLQWYHNRLLVTGYEGSIGPELLLEVGVRGTKGTILGRSFLRDYGHKWGADAQFVVRSGELISGGYPGYYLHAWPFPQGGRALRRLARTPDGWWYGVTISVALRKK